MCASDAVMSEAESTIVPSRSNSTADQVRAGAMVWVGIVEVIVTSYGYEV